MTILVTVQHARQAKLGGPGVLCAVGIRGWCEQHDIDLQAFLDHGLPVEQLEAIDDAYAQRVAAIARADAEVNRG